MWRGGTRRKEQEGGNRKGEKERDEEGEETAAKRVLAGQRR